MRPLLTAHEGHSPSHVRQCTLHQHSLSSACLAKKDEEKGSGEREQRTLQGPPHLGEPLGLVDLLVGGVGRGGDSKVATILHPQSGNV